MITHFYMIGFCLALAATIAQGVARRQVAVVACLLLASIQAWPIFRYSGPNPVPAATGRRESGS